MKPAPVLAALAALSLAARPARAADPVTLLGVQASVDGGTWFAAPNGPVDHELARARWSPLPRVLPEAQIRFGVTVHDFTLDMRFAGSGASFAGPPGSGASGSYYPSSIGVDLGTRVGIGRSFSVAPSVGVGSFGTTLCFTAPPSGSSSPALSPFAQVAKNPGQGGACLNASALALDVGLALRWTLPVRPLLVRGEPVSRMYPSLGLKLGYSLRLSDAGAWSTQPDADHPLVLPAFQGPVAPVGGAYVGLEARFALAGILGKPR